jgi:uracil-DNA glycosylase
MAQVLATHPADLVPPNARISTARLAAAGCRSCDLWRDATQTVFGEGPADAPLMLVGEQPGDLEDLAGHPFVGPAGRVLDEALAEAGIDREQVFVTNVVKHFRWKPSPGGKRRLHERPTAAQVRACRPWVELERQLVDPRVMVALGATAAQALIDPDFRITEQRGVLLPPSSPDGARLLATPHPSSILRLTDRTEREAARRVLAGDLAVAWEAATS